MAALTDDILFAILLVASSTIYLSAGVPQETLATICSKTESQKTCLSLLNADPRTSSADLPQLSLISIELMMKHAGDNFKTFSEFRDNATDSRVKNSFNNCVGFYQDMQAKIEVAHRLSEKKLYKDITDQLDESQSLAYKCIAAVPINSVAIDTINRAMILTCEISISVNKYIAG